MIVIYNCNIYDHHVICVTLLLCIMLYYILCLSLKIKKLKIRAKNKIKEK